ncbi:MAG: TIGR03088 family PEP-CTERM/XrtA system glycosyltransferase [Gammaproteobacteria bacterium]|nr:TIGR03088 family PEP-CTERM/XrtA system glycosyltransferase [Pseudomonadales bacterium]MCP5346800.1 TIGR03088 family PEP-CTERM/XrtA system glycosyltransferase [Pseudomonadales bacterium]
MRQSSQPPQLVHIIFALGTGGLENGLVNIINRCPPERYRHAIICLSQAEDFARRLTAPDVEVIELHKKPGHDLGMYWRLWRHLRRLRPAIVHTRNLAALETQILGLLMPRCKRVHGEHGRDMHDLDGSNRKYNSLRRFLSPLIHRFVAVSQDLSRWLTETVGIPADKVTQIYNGVDTRRFAPVPDDPTDVADLPEGFRRRSDRLVIGTVGRLAAVKDQRLLLEAMHRLLAERPELRDTLRLIIVGDGPEREALITRIEQLSLQDSVWLAGDREDIPELLRALDLFALPSLAEGISNTILEAMASGLPVVASSVGGNPELVQEEQTGLLFPAGDEEALTHALNRLIDDLPLRQAMGLAATAYIRRHFDWQRTVESYLAVYDALLYPETIRSGVREH